jgi:hypothetical protein
VSDANSPTAHGTSENRHQRRNDVATENTAFSFDTLKMMSSDTHSRKGGYLRGKGKFQDPGIASGSRR